jgi:hypothetical protein
MSADPAGRPGTTILTIFEGKSCAYTPIGIQAAAAAQTTEAVRKLHLLIPVRERCMRGSITTL